MACSLFLIAAIIAPLIGAVAFLAWRMHAMDKAARRREAEAKAELQALLSHELRTPLHGWLALVELLEGTDLDPRQRHYVELMRQSASQLAGLADDILGIEGNHEPAPAGGAAVSLPAGARLLFADDVELNRLVLREFLSETGCVVDEAADGAEAFGRVEHGRYDLVVLDLRMPVMDGFDAARAIRAREARLNLPAMPLVALSAGASARDRQQAMDAGFDLFLAKPIERGALIAALRKFLPAEMVGAVESPLPPPPNIPEGLEHMLPLFVVEMGKDSDALQSLAGDGDIEPLADHVHAMRGKCGMFGEERLFDLLTRLEVSVKAQERQEWPKLVHAIVERSAQLREYAPHS